MNENTLNNRQKQVVTHTRGEMLVVAGAGTGKTKTIVERIASLIENGVDKSQILALTFTEKAAHEMLDRVSERLNESYGVELAIHTFNAFGQLLLEEFATEVGLSRQQKLVGEDGRVVFMREHIDTFKLEYFSLNSRPDNQFVTLADYFSELKQQLVSPESYLEFAQSLPDDDAALKLEKKKHLELAQAYQTYTRLMREHNVIDYDDQIYLVIQILEQRPNIVKRLQDRYSHIMIDEFQDTNPMQSRLVDILYGGYNRHSRSLIVVGDDDQAIYEWRGATLANILQFRNRYPKAEKVALLKNYRNTQEILDSAWTLIQHNNPNRLESIEQLDKKLIAEKGSGIAPRAIQFKTQQEEVMYVAEYIKKSVEESNKAGQPPSIAVLTRSKRLVKLMHDMLESSAVEHSVAGLGEDLYKQPIISMMLDALSAIWQPEQNDLALYHTLTSKLFSCDPVEISQSAHDARSKHIPLYTILKTSQAKTVQSALTLIDSLHQQVSHLHVRALSYALLDKSGLKTELYNDALTSNEAEREVLLLGQWFETLQDFEAITTTPSVFSYLENIAVLKAEGETVDDTQDIVDGVPVVMTIHKAKGLEWDTVFLIGANERSFPYLGGGSSLKIPDELRKTVVADSRIYEERRLMYVATTRARKEFIITHSTSVSGGKTKRKASRFIEEMKIPIDDKPSTVNFRAELEKYIDSYVAPRVGLPKKFIDGDYIVLTASQAEDYLECPLNFYYKHVLGVPDISGPETEVGSLIHALIQEINDAKKHSQPLPEISILQKKLDKEWPERGYASKKQRDQKLRHAKSAFNVLYQRLENEPTPIAVEESFRIKIPNSRCILYGRLDAVVPYEEGIEIHDYKTNTGVVDHDKAKSKVSASKQLTMYALAWRILRGKKPDTVALDFVLTGQVGRMKKQDKSLDTMELKLAEVAEKIKASEFPAGQKHDYCVHP